MERSDEARRLDSLYDRLRVAERSNKRLQIAMDALIRIKECADGKTELVSNQGQTLDGYSELANYRSIIEQFMEGGD